MSSFWTVNDFSCFTRFITNLWIGFVGSQEMCFFNAILRHLFVLRAAHMLFTRWWCGVIVMTTYSIFTRFCDICLTISEFHHANCSLKWPDYSLNFGWLKWSTRLRVLADWLNITQLVSSDGHIVMNSSESTIWVFLNGCIITDL